MAKKKEKPVEAKNDGKMTADSAKKLAEKYLPKEESKRFDTIVVNGEEVKRDKFDVMYVTSDGNVFYKQNEGSGRSHARRNKLELFEVKF